jgi:hypothetical protein
MAAKEKVKEVIAATPYSKGGQGDYPSRYVILKWTKGDGTVMEYSRHMQIKDGVHKDYFIYGHYFRTYADAMSDLLRSVETNNKGISPKNVSYIPAGIKQTAPKSKKVK